MHVHAIASLIFHRLRHEARQCTESFGDGANAPLHANNLIAIGDGVIGVGNIDFVLGRGCFLQDALVGQTLCLKTGFQRFKQRRMLIERAESIKIAAGFILRRQRVPQCLVVIRALEQVELELNGDPGDEAFLLKLVDHLCQHLSGIREEGGAVVLEHGQYDLRAVYTGGRQYRDQRVRHRLTPAIEIPVVERDPGHVAAPGVLRHG